MGLIGKALGLSGAVSEFGAAVSDVAEVFVPNATKDMVLGMKHSQPYWRNMARNFKRREPGFLTVLSTA